jgi:dinuclear metal center YbgI/SA1388 family protein
MPTVKEIISCLETFAPAQYQESYDNSGLQIGNISNEISSVLLSLDVTEEVLDEAIELGANLIIAHHPLIFSGIKRITGRNYIERVIQKAIKSDIAIYACHTNIDNVSQGVSFRMAQKLGLIGVKALRPADISLVKLVTFVPEAQAVQVRNAIFKARAGHIGNYDCCSFNLQGTGTFRPLEGTNPFSGQVGQLQLEPETRIETILPDFLTNQVVSAMIKAHPYEEVAYDIYPLKNAHPVHGSGAVGELSAAVDSATFLKTLKEVFNVPTIRHTRLVKKQIKKVALCGGSGSFLLKDARRANADIFITGDFKYHQFFEAENDIIIADIGHFESEQFTLEIFYELLMKNFSKFAVRFTKVNTNPINYS